MITTKAKGMFVWYELCTRDSKAAQRFYADVLGWTTKDMSSPGGTYTIVSAGKHDIGGIMELPAEAWAGGAKPGWMPYIGVDDVDAYADRVKAAGGAILRPPQDVPGTVRFSVVADPHGAPFMLMTPLSREERPVPPPGTPGDVGWRELHAGNGEAAWAFYSDLFGWTKGEAMDMGPQGVYQLFTTGGEPVGGMMTKMPQSPAPFWMLYFNVPALDVAVVRAKEAGATLISGPMEVPGGQWIAGFLDPQGAVFSLVAPRR